MIEEAPVSEQRVAVRNVTQVISETDDTNAISERDGTTAIRNDAKARRVIVGAAIIVETNSACNGLAATVMNVAGRLPQDSWVVQVFHSDANAAELRESAYLQDLEAEGRLHHG